MEESTDLNSLAGVPAAFPTGSLIRNILRETENII